MNVGLIATLSFCPLANPPNRDDGYCKKGAKVEAILDKQNVSHNVSSLPVASVAQLAEQLTLNQLVEGSSPSRGTTPKIKLFFLKRFRSGYFARR